MVCCSTWYEKLPMSMYVGSGMHYAAPPDLDSEYLCRVELHSSMLLHPTWTCNKNDKGFFQSTSPSSGQISPCKG